MSSTFLERSRHRVVASALLIAWSPIVGGRAIAQAPPEVKAMTPEEDGPTSTSESTIVVEPPEPTLPPLEFDRSELDLARGDALFTRNLFLISGGATAFGWILLGAAISQCEWINDVEVCPRRADNAGVAGALIVTVSSVSLLVTGIMYGVRSRQRKQLELKTLQRLSRGGKSPPPLSFDEYRLTDVQAQVRATRIALLATTAVFSVSWIFLGAAIPRCEAGTNELDCTGSGYANLVIGLTFGSTGTIGMIVSGILLGVRKGNKRTLERSIHKRRGGRFRWDPQSGSFVF